MGKVLQSAGFVAPGSLPGPPHRSSPRVARRMASRLRLLLLVAALPLLLWGVLPMISSGATQSEIQQKIQHKQALIQQRKAREGVLTSDIAGYTHRIDSLQGDITTLQDKQVRLQSDL